MALIPRRRGGGFQSFTNPIHLQEKLAFAFKKKANFDFENRLRFCILIDHEIFRSCANHCILLCRGSNLY